MAEASRSQGLWELTLQCYECLDSSATPFSASSIDIRASEKMDSRMRQERAMYAEKILVALFGNSSVEQYEFEKC